MEISNRNKVLIVAGLMALAFGSGYFSKPTKVVTKTETKEVIKEVVKVVDNTKTQTNVDRTTTIKETKNKDGSTTTETIIEDKTKVSQDSHTTTDTQRDSTKTNSTSTVITNDIGLTIQALAIVDSGNLKGNREYGVYATKRVISNVNVGLMLTTDKKIGVGVGLSF